MTIDPQSCHRALSARDVRFDGVFFVGVTTTGVYCRPVCAARTPRPDRCRYFSSAAAAERDGFRACLRCRPELAPGLGPSNAAPRLADTAARRIAEGALNDGTVGDLAAALGVSARHLQRALVAHLGVSPVELAQTRRLALAKGLLHDSRLGLAEVALASGYGSVRRFNAAFRARFGRPPSAVRRALSGADGAGSEGTIRLRLAYRPPLAWDALLTFLAGRAIPGVESVAGDAYRRTVALAGKAGWIAVAPGGPGVLVAEASAGLAGPLMPLVARLRHLLDLDARPADIELLLARDPLLRRRIAARRGLRVPGAFDGYEAAVRAILGQQVTVKGATTLAGRLVARLGAPLETPYPGLTHLFPPAPVLAAAGADAVAGLGMPGARARALVELARAVEGGLRLAPGVPVEPVLERLRALPGIGDWTAQYVAMRALGWPDAFPVGDLGLRHALGLSRPGEVLARAERWRPWRAYATLHLWTGGSP